MSRITSVKIQKNKKRVNIYLDNEFGFGIDLENFIKLGLKVDQELSEKEVTEIVKKAEFQKVLDKILRFATLRPRSKEEINSWLKRKKVHESLYEELFNRLKRLELTGDRKFAKWWIEQRMSFRPKPKGILKQELRIKGVSKEIIKEVLEETEIDEKEIARELIEKNKYKWEKLSGFERKRKMSEYLGRKGFGWEVIQRMVGQFDSMEADS